MALTSAKRLIPWMLAVLLTIGICLWMADSYLEKSARKAAAGPGGKDFHEVSAKALELEVRANVPLGSNRDFVEDFLKKKGMEFDVDPSAQTVVARAPYLKGSSWIVYESIIFIFQFDEASRLKSIDARTYLTGL